MINGALSITRLSELQEFLLEFLQFSDFLIDLQQMNINDVIHRMAGLLWLLFELN